MNKKVLTVLVAMMLVLTMGLTFAGCKGKKVKNKAKTEKNSTAGTVELPPVEDYVDGESHENDPDFAKDATVITTDEATAADGEKDGEKTSDGTAEKNEEQTSAVTVEKNSYIVVPVVLKKNPGAAAAQFTVNYDKDVFTYVDFESGEVFDGHNISAAVAGKVKVLLEADGLVDITDSGTLITLKFKVAENAKAGTYSFKVTDEMFANLNEEALTPALSIGQVVIG